MDAAALLPPQRPGRILVAVLALARAAAPGWWSAAELACMDALPGLALADAIARLAQRRGRSASPAETLRWAGGAGDPLGAACAAGWLHCPAAGPAQTALAAAPPSPAALTPAAGALVEAALALATGGEREAWSGLVRTGLGQLPAPPGSPLAAVLAGRWPDLAPPPWADRAALDAWLAAGAARAAGPSPEGLPALLAALAAAEGAPWRRLGHQRTAAHAWARLGQAHLGTLAPGSPAHRRLLRALRRCPLEPAVAAAVWTEVWRVHRLRPLGRRLAAAYAAWPLWSGSERARWRHRAAGTARREAPAWEERATAVGLVRDGGGAVLADGVRVEERVLALLAAEGWSGIHAEGGFWALLAERLAASVLAAPVAGAWVGPLQREPLDRGRPGWLARRAAAVAALARALWRDQRAAVEATIPPDDRGWYGASARAVAAALPTPVLAALLVRCLERAENAAGLPDLLAWRNGAVALWEVKSPGDALSDAQRDWLRWGAARGLAVGVWRLTARPGGQPRLPPPAPPRTAGPARERCAWTLRGPGAPPLSREPHRPPAAFTAEGVADGRGALRPLGGWLLLRRGAVLAERRRGGRVLERRWHLLPAGWCLPVALVPEALPAGGVLEAGVLPARRAGWWWPARFASEPVLLPGSCEAAGVAEALAGAAVHPGPPLDPEALAEAAGLGDALRMQSALVGAEPCAVVVEAGVVALALDPALGVLWPSPEVGRRPLPAIAS